MQKLLIWIGCSLWLLSMNNSFSYAQDAPKKIDAQWVIGAGLYLGGESVAEIYFEDGSEQPVRAGQGGAVFVGGQFAWLRLPDLYVRTTAGIKYVTTKADNAHIRLSRFPITMTAHYKVTDKIHIGAGVTSHQGIRFKSDGIGGDGSFTSKPGPVLEIGYGDFAFTYTKLAYHDDAHVRYDASAFGLTASTAIRGFGKKKK